MTLLDNKYHELQLWFKQYTSQYLPNKDAQQKKSTKKHLEVSSPRMFFDDAQIVDGITTKIVHTYKVVANCEMLAKHLGLSEDEYNLARIIGLLHDIGRFYQFATYRTFNDALSENHATLALKLIDEYELLSNLDSRNQEIIRFAIGNHNARTIELTTDMVLRDFAKLIRDADKIDIYRVLEPYLMPTDGTGCSPDFIELFNQGLQCDYTKMRTQDDRKLVRLLWIYDINYTWSLARLQELGYVEMIISRLPQDEIMQIGYAKLRAYIENKLTQIDTWHSLSDYN